MSHEIPALSVLVWRLVEGADQQRNLSLDKLNELIPPGYPVEKLDDIYEELRLRRITVVDSEREARLEERRVKSLARLEKLDDEKGDKTQSATIASIKGRMKSASTDEAHTQEEVMAVPAVEKEAEVAENSDETQSNGDAPEAYESSDTMHLLTSEEQMELLANPSRHYLGKLSRARRLCKDEEDELAKKAASGDEKSRQRLVSAYLPLVARIARRYKRSGIPTMELILAGNEGLVEAAHHHNPREGVTFAHTARWWIGHRLSRCVAENWRASRLPQREARRLRKMAKIVARYQAKRGKSPSPAFLSRAMKISIDEIFFLKGLFESPLSLQAPVGGDAEGGTLADRIPDLLAKDGAKQAQHQALRAQLDDLLDTLGVIERQILVLRFGLEDQVSRSLEEVARLTGLTRNAVQQYEETSLRKLRTLA